MNLALQVQDDCVEWHTIDKRQNLHPRDLIFHCETCLETLTSANSARQHLEYVAMPAFILCFKWDHFKSILFRRHMAQTRESFCSWMSQLFARGHLTSPVVCGGCKVNMANIEVRLTNSGSSDHFL